MKAKVPLAGGICVVLGIGGHGVEARNVIVRDRRGLRLGVSSVAVEIAAANGAVRV